VKETSPDSADLWVVLTGGRLEKHAAVSLTILDEAGQDHWAHGLTGSRAHGRGRRGRSLGARLGTVGVQHRRQRTGCEQSAIPGPAL
jgi:hypothetical protein